MSGWAIDLGTTNTGVARWDDAAARPRLIELSDICRRPGGEDHLEAPRLIPSAVQVHPESDFWTRVGTWPFFAKRVFWGRQADIGRPALEQNDTQIHPNFARGFKADLGRSPFRILARAGKRTVTARDVARIFLRELLAEVKVCAGERIRDLVVTTPVDSYESYRAELLQILKGLGIKRTRFVDEPVAAAIGYGLSLRQARLVLVVDFGGGTLDLALVNLTAKGMQEGTCEVLAKEGRGVGGNTVDRWLLSEFCEQLEYPLDPRSHDEASAFWYRVMLAEACRVKESVFFNERDVFRLMPPEEMRVFEARIRGEAPELEVSSEMLVEILEKNGLYQTLDECMAGIARQAGERGIDAEDIEDVLMVGGSTLLPGVYPQFEARFGRGQLRAWQPFEAVAYGACAFAADSFTQSDFIVHDYAFITYNRKTHDPEYTVIVPRGTRVPTGQHFWKRRLVPTCSLGEPETMFKLVICEIGRSDDGERRFGWDESGKLHKLGGKGGGSGDGDQLVVPLNESNPTLGYLKPAHPPSDRSPRLEISFGVNADRWLTSTVLDLKTRKPLMKEEPVVKLL